MDQPQASQEPTQQEVIDAVYNFAAQEMARGTSPVQVERKLIEQGLPEEAARSIVQDLRQIRSQVNREAGKKNMIYGALWCVGGIVVTAVTFQAAANGGSYVVAWGAILFGGIQCIRGLAQMVGGE